MLSGFGTLASDGIAAWRSLSSGVKTMASGFLSAGSGVKGWFHIVLFYRIRFSVGILEDVLFWVFATSIVERILEQHRLAAGNCDGSSASIVRPMNNRAAHQTFALSR